MPYLRSRASVVALALAILAAPISIVACSDESSEAAPVKSNRPNFIIVLTDDQTVADMQVMRYTRGRRDWVRFRRALLENPLCCPSRATILTGQYDFHTGVFDNTGSPFEDGNTLATWLDDAGYETALFGKYLNKYPFEERDIVPPGWDQWWVFGGEERGYYFNYTAYDGEEPVTYGENPEDYSTDVLAAKAEDFISSSRQPFFLYLAPTSPHGPNTPAPRHEDAHIPPIEFPPNFNERDVSDKPEWVQRLKMFDRGQAKRKAKERRRTLLATDEAIKRVFKALKASGEIDDTYVIFLSDNGFALGEHRSFGKSCGYEECVRTPLLIRGPGLKPHRVRSQVSNVDLASTIADFAGIKPGLPQDGVSLRPVLEGEKTGSRPILIHAKPLESRRPEWLGVSTNRYKFIRTNGGEIELYDLREDRYELENLAYKPAYADEVERLSRIMRRLRPAREAGPATGG